MKKICVFAGLLLALWSCNDSSNNTSATGSDTGVSPGAIDDETQHPGGVSNQNVISRDTAAYNVERMSDTTKPKSQQ
jgi:hypothetical protein